MESGNRPRRSTLEPQPPFTITPRRADRSVLLPAGVVRIIEVGAASNEVGLEQLEKASRGRLGVVVLDTSSGARLSHRADERFPMCGTFKLLALAAVLARVDRGVEQLHRRIPFGKADLLEYALSPLPGWPKGSMTVAELCVD